MNLCVCVYIHMYIFSDYVYVFIYCTLITKNNKSKKSQETRKIETKQKDFKFPTP